MSIQRNLDPNRKLVLTTMMGVVTSEELIRHFRTVREMDGHDCVELIDARRVWRVGFNVSDLPTLAAKARDVFAGRSMACRAMVVDDMFHFGIARVFASLTAAWVSIRVFESLDEADFWLTQSQAAS